MLLKLLLVAILLNIAGCGEAKQNNTAIETTEVQAKNPQEKLQVTVSILPQKYFVEKIGGDLVSVNVMVEAGAVAETYEPKPQQLAQLASSRVYFAIGVPFEETWLKKITAANSNIPIINTGEGIEKIPLVGQSHHGHENGHEPTHKQENQHEKHKQIPDPHIWLSPRLVKIQAERIYETLSKVDQKNEHYYRKNLENFKKEIENIDKRIREILADIKRRKYIVYHPAWGYFARDYNLQQIPLEVEGQEVSSVQLAKLINQAKQEGIRHVFAPPQFNSKTLEIFAREIGGQVVIIDDLAENWAENLLITAEKLAQSMR